LPPVKGRFPSEMSVSIVKGDGQLVSFGDRAVSSKAFQRRESVSQVATNQFVAQGDTVL